MEKNISWCPNCGGEIRFKKVPFFGQEVICRQCNTALVVVEKSPIELDWADYEDNEEYPDFDEEYEEPDSRSRLSRN